MKNQEDTHGRMNKLLCEHEKTHIDKNIELHRTRTVIVRTNIYFISFDSVRIYGSNRLNRFIVDPETEYVASKECKVWKYE